MSETKVMKLSEVCRVYQPETISKKSLPVGGTFPVYGANGKIGFNDKYNHEDPQLLLGCRGSVGSIHISEPFSWINGNAMVVQPFETIVTRDYLKYALLGGINIKSAISGTAQPQITRESLSPIQISVPSLEKQNNIVEKLDAAFAEIDLLEGNLGLGDEKANQLLQSLLSSAFSSTKEQNDFTKLFTVIPDSKSKIKSSSYLESGKYAVVDQGKELVAGYTDTSLTVDEKSLPVVVFGDHTRAVKYVDFPFTAGADGTQILKPSALTNPKYGFYLVLHAVGQIPSKGYARHFGELKKMQFQLPSLGEQRKIVEKLDSAFVEIEILKAQVNIKKDYATALRQSLLSSAFTQEEAVA
jgi:type I restriction enzyme S subunit